MKKNLEARAHARAVKAKENRDIKQESTIGRDSKMIIYILKLYLLAAAQ